MRSLFALQFYLSVLFTWASASLPHVRRSLSLPKAGFGHDEIDLVSSSAECVKKTVEISPSSNTEKKHASKTEEIELQPVGESVIVAPVNHQKRYKAELAELLVFATGISKVICFRRFGFFSCMMTGNAMRLGTALAELRMADARFYACTILVCTLGAALFQFLSLRHQFNIKKGRKQRNPYEVLSLIAFCLFAGTDVVGRLFSNLPERWLGCLMAFGFGFVNAICIKETSVVTWAASGHVNKLGTGLVDAFFLGRESLEGSRANLRIFGIFVLSVLCSVWLCHREDVVRPFLRHLPPMGTCFGLYYAVALALYGSKMKSVPCADTGLWEPLHWWFPFTSRNHRGYGVLSTGNNSTLSAVNSKAWL